MQKSKYNNSNSNQGGHDQGKTAGKIIFFPGPKSQGISLLVRKIWKGLGKSGSLKTYYVQGKTMYFLEKVWAYPPSSVRLLLKERICSLGEQNLSCKSNPQYSSEFFPGWKSWGNLLLVRKIWKGLGKPRNMKGI